MLEKLVRLPPGIEGVEAVGEVTLADLSKVLRPLLESVRRTPRRVALCLHFGRRFDRFCQDVAREEAPWKPADHIDLDSCALVGDAPWIGDVAMLGALLVPCPVRAFPSSQLDGAIEWLASRRIATTAYRTLPESGIIIVDVCAPLVARDIDELADAADRLIEEHTALRGIVLQARRFPGSESLGALQRHLRFMRDHRNSVRVVAVATDSDVTGVVTSFAEVFARAEVKSFPYAATDRALTWARDTSSLD